MYANVLTLPEEAPNSPDKPLDPEQRSLRILAIDDQIAERMRLVRLLEKLGYQVTACGNGTEALELTSRQSFDLVISDWRMPKMNGLDLCRALRADAEIDQPYFILLTGRDTKTDLIAGMDAGADDFVTKPYSADEVRVRVQAGERIIRLQSDLKARNLVLQYAMSREQEFLRQTREDIKAAAVMQQALLPPDRGWAHGWETASLFRPASGVAGDIFDCFKLDNRTLGFYHLDVAGHGIASAMLSFTLSRLLSPEHGDAANMLYQPRQPGRCSEIAEPAEVVATLNNRFQDIAVDARFFTMVYGYVDLQSCTGKLCQAGHPHPLLRGADGTVTKLGEGGLPVGVFPDVEFSQIEFEIPAGSSLILYSDGAPECLNQGRQPLGSEQLARSFTSRSVNGAVSIVKILERELDAWLGDAELQDDISALVISAPQGGDRGE